MQVEIEDSGPNRKTLKVTVTPERVRAALADLYKTASRQVQIKGFRPGKVPQHVLRARLGDSILAQAKESIINETFREAMESNHLEIVGDPKLDVDDAQLDEGKELRYTVEFELRPEVKVGDIRSVEVRRRPTEPTGDEVRRAVEDLAHTKRRLQAVDDEIEPSDFAKVAMSYRIDGQEVVAKDGLRISPGIPVRGCDPDEFRGKLVGQKNGDTVTIPIHYPDTFENEEARGKDGELRVSIQEIMRFVTPPVDDELAKTFGFDSVGDLERDLRAKLGQEKARLEDTRIEEEVLDQLYAENPFTLPEGLVAAEVEHRARHFAEELGKQGLSPAEARTRVEQARGEIEEVARKGVRNLFLIEGIMKKEKLFVTESDVDAELRRIASENDTTLADVRKHVEERKLLPEIRIEIMNRKVRESLRRTAAISDSEEAGGS